MHHAWDTIRAIRRSATPWQRMVFDVSAIMLVADLVIWLAWMSFLFVRWVAP